MKVRIYLAGAIGCYGVDAEYPKLWRKMASEWFDIYSGHQYDYNFRCIDPTQYYEYGKNYHKSEREVMLFDLRKIKSSDVVLINLKDIEKSPDTIIELFYAWNNNIPVIGFCESINDRFNVPPRIVELVDRLEIGENAMKKAMIYIKDYYGESR